MIRIATEADRAEAQRLHRLAWKSYEAGSEMPEWDTPGKPEETLDTYLDAGQLVVAEKDGALVGMVAVGIWGEWWMLLNIYVDDAHRGNGIAQDMVKRAHEVARGLGAKHGYIWAPNRLTKFYEVAGYQPVGRVMVRHA